MNVWMQMPRCRVDDSFPAAGAAGWSCSLSLHVNPSSDKPAGNCSQHVLCSPLIRVIERKIIFHAPSPL